ncbi:MAG: hypothetical protein LC624_12740 [Halobacteriales archaeon]|nr:hypothetical protein [Halobacteriales archaeon]
MGHRRSVPRPALAGSASRPTLGLAVLALLALPLAGCLGGPSGNPNLNPPCVASKPLGIDIAADKDRYRPGELMNVTLFLNNTGAARSLHFRLWELTLRSFDGRVIRTYQRDESPEVGGVTRGLGAGERGTLQPTFQPWRVVAELQQPLQPGLYYLCATLHADRGEAVQGARSFTADKPPNTL